MDSKIYEALQKVVIDAGELKVGDLVKVKRPWETGEQGFPHATGGAVYGMVYTKTFRIREIRTDCIVLENGYCYPFFVLEKVGDRHIKILIDPTFHARIDSIEKLVHIGSFKIPFHKIREIAKAVDSVDKPSVVG